MCSKIVALYWTFETSDLSTKNCIGCVLRSPISSIPFVTKADSKQIKEISKSNIWYDVTNIALQKYYLDKKWIVLYHYYGIVVLIHQTFQNTCTNMPFIVPLMDLQQFHFVWIDAWLKWNAINIEMNLLLVWISLKIQLKNKNIKIKQWFKILWFTIYYYKTII